MSETTMPISLVADALGVSAQALLDLVQASAPTAPDPTLVALTVEEAARRLSVGRTTMYALLASGEIPSVAVGRLRRIPAEALNDYVAARTRFTRSTVALAA
ncbi:helix-turn-helix domain-containing protein [Streptomyces sp. H10-C2]|uniref:helix-turn-helix domain-containing protein n=1 Tax=unclassified Streptomyces TaxID=2593676 RepID=UPI0024BBA8A4|nr:MULTISPECIES: helix-turn-helix domain-containing protein [unclassified Streptomyces]MDJ0342602.1 helix-turn-helix domain-containing protein [Streptomyces sp. PH10-H1]MDJ0368544.1 helix-turn-helix domain-containing protein [Streptomyces sp. H10-C2]